MPRNGSGVYNLPAGNPVVAGTVIDPAWANTTLTDIGTAMTGSMPRDGEAAPTANLPMGSFKLTGLGTPSTAGDSLAWGSPAAVTTILATSDSGGYASQLLTTAGSGGMVIKDQAGARKIELFFAGSTSGGFYGIGSSQTVLNFNASTLFAISFADLAKVYFDNSGRVGIGGSPSNQLDIFVAATGDVLRVRNSGTAFETKLGTSVDSGYLDSGNTDLALRRNGTEFLRISTTSVAIGAVATPVRVTSDGRLYGSALHNNAGSMTGTATQYVGSGTYTPTFTPTANVTSATTNGVWKWIRVGNVVTATGSMNVTCTANSGAFSVGVSLPIASNFASSNDAGGASVNWANSGMPAGVDADTVNKRFTIHGTSNSLVAQVLGVSAQYEVL